MKTMALAKRNFKDTWLDLLSLGLVIFFPPALFLMAMNMGNTNPFFTAGNLLPGVVLFGLSLLSLSAGMLLSKDREKAFLTRLLTAPLRAKDFIMAYSLPYIPIALTQLVVLYAIAVAFGMEMTAGVWMGFLIMFVLSIGFIGLGLVLGTAFTYKSISIAWLPINLLIMLSGTWGELDAFGSGIQTVVKFFPFSHALDAIRTLAAGGTSFGAVLPDLYWVLGYTIVIIVAGIYLFKRKMTE